MAPQTSVRREPRRHFFDDLNTDGIPWEIEARFVEARRGVQTGGLVRAYLDANALEIEGRNLRDHGLTREARAIGARMVELAAYVQRLAVEAGAFGGVDED